MIIGRIPRRLRLVLGLESPVADVATPDDPARVDFVAYAADCRVFGRVGLPSGRLSDLLNRFDEYELVDVQLESIADGHVTSSPVVLASRDELIAVHAAGPAGLRAMRTHTRAWPILIQAQPYLIRGYLHALPGSDPIASFRHRKPMIPLTDAWIEYLSAGTPVRVSVGTIVVNRELADWFRLTVIDEPELPELPAGKVGPLTKDFTGDLLLTRQER